MGTVTALLMCLERHEKIARACSKATRIPDRDLLKAIDRFRQTAQDILLADIDIFQEKQLELRLWVTGFHRPISDCRKVISEEDTQPTDRYEKFVRGVIAFIDEGVKFYLILLAKIKAVYGSNAFELSASQLAVVGARQDHLQPKEQPQDTSKLVARSLVAIGDLIRYKMQFGVNTSKEADHYYKEASRVDYDNGKPYNQLAVLASSRDDTGQCIFMYTRSLACRQPLTLTHENLTAEFEKVAEKFKDLPKPPLVNGTCSFIGWSLNDVCRLVEISMLYLNGMLYDGRDHAQFDKVMEVCYPAFIEAISRNVAGPPGRGPNCSEEMIFRLSALALFHPSHVAAEQQAARRCGNAEEQIHCQQREAYALNLIHILTTALAKTLAGETTMLSWGPGNSVICPALIVLIYWLSENPSSLHVDEDSRGSTARFALRELASLLMCCAATCESNQKSVKSVLSAEGPLLALPEDFQLQGYLPLAPVLEVFDYKQPVITEDCPRMRLERLIVYLDILCQKLSALVCDSQNTMSGNKPHKEVVKFLRTWDTLFKGPLHNSGNPGLPPSAEPQKQSQLSQSQGLPEFLPLGESSPVSTGSNVDGQLKTPASERSLASLFADNSEKDYEEIAALITDEVMESPNSSSPLVPRCITEGLPGLKQSSPKEEQQNSPLQGTSGTLGREESPKQFRQTNSAQMAAAQQSKNQGSDLQGKPDIFDNQVQACHEEWLNNPYIHPEARYPALISAIHPPVQRSSDPEVRRQEDRANMIAAQQALCQPVCPARPVSASAYMGTGAQVPIPSWAGVTLAEQTALHPQIVDAAYRQAGIANGASQQTGVNILASVLQSADNAIARQQAQNRGGAIPQWAAHAQSLLPSQQAQNKPVAFPQNAGNATNHQQAQVMTYPWSAGVGLSDHQAQIRSMAANHLQGQEISRIRPLFVPQALASGQNLHVPRQSQLYHGGTSGPLPLGNGQRLQHGANFQPCQKGLTSPQQSSFHHSSDYPGPNNNQSHRQLH